MNYCPSLGEDFDGPVVSFAMWTWVFLTAFLACLAGLLIIPLIPFDPRRRAFEVICRAWGRGIFWALAISVTIDDPSGFRSSEERFIICPNHQSLLDAALLLGFWPGIRLVAKRSLYYFPFFAVQIWLSGHIRAGKGKGDDSVRVSKAVQRAFSQGASIGIFPEGTRSPDGTVRRFQRGAFTLARDAGRKILPVAIQGSGRLLPKHSFLVRRRGSVHVTVLPPIEPKGTPKELAVQARARIQAVVHQGQLFA
jgi:1-acyl-sn-glycerol-3-phosphate acyltransferase